MKNITEKIKKLYSEFLSAEELLFLNNNPTEEYIRKLINKIWNNYLTNPFLFKSGEDFRFIVCITPASFDFALIDSVPFEYPDEYYLLTNNNILDKSIAFTSGYVVKINWEQTDKIYLPDDLLKETEIKTIKDPIGVFTVGVGDTILNPSYTSALLSSKTNKFAFISIDKRDYSNNYELTEDDLYNITYELLYDYLVSNTGNILCPVNKKDIKKFKKYISSLFQQEISKHTFDPNIFEAKVFAYLDKYKIIEKQL